MKVLILGGTGAMGVHLVAHLAAQGHRITVTTRTERPDQECVTFIKGNARDPVFFNSLLDTKWDAIVDFMVYSTEEFTVRSENLLKSTDHYIYLSSARVYANSDEPITEDSPRLLDVSTDQDYLSTDEYALTKARQENILFSSKRRNWSIIRPYITYNDQRLQLGVLEKEDWLYRALQGRTLVSLADIQNKQTTLTHGADVAAGIASLVGNQNAHGEAFHITACEPIKWEKILNIYLEVIEEHTGWKPKHELQQLNQFTRWRKGKYQIVYDRLYDRHFCNDKINEFVATANFISAELGLRQCIESFLQQGKDFKKVNWRAEAIKDREFKERAALAEIRGVKEKVKYLLIRHSGLL